MRGQLGSHPGTRPLPRPHPTTEASEASETSPSETSEERRVLSCFPCQAGVGLSYTKLYLHCLFNSSQRKLAKLKRFCSPYAAGLGTQHPSAFLRQSPKIKHGPLVWWVWCRVSLNILPTGALAGLLSRQLWEDTERIAALKVKASLRAFQGRRSTGCIHS